MQKIRQRIKAKRLFVLFLCLELLVVSLGWKAFYASPEELSVTDSVPSEYYAPILPPEDWRVQRQWFTAQGEYFNRIIFYTAEHAGKNGGITVEEYPVLSAAFYQDANGNFGSYSYTEELLQSERLRRYFYYEYNSLLSPKNRMGELFFAG